MVFPGQPGTNLPGTFFLTRPTLVPTGHTRCARSASLNTGIKVDDTEEIVSFDVKVLYTSLPLTRTIDVVRKRLEEHDSWTHGTPLQSSHIVELLELYLTSTYFSFQDRFYQIK